MRRHTLATLGFFLLALLVAAVPMVTSCSKATVSPTSTPTQRPTVAATATQPGPTPTLSATTGAKPKEYVMSTQDPMTGPAGVWGQLEQGGIKMAVEEINAAGGINGVPIKMYYEDNQAQPRPAVEAATKAIDVDGAKVIFGSGSPAMPAIRPITEEKHIILFSDAARLPQADYQGNKYFFSNISTREQEAEAMAALPDKLGYNTAIIDYANNAWGQGTAQMVKQSWEAKGHKVLDIQSHELDQKDFRTTLVKYKAANPDAFFLLVYSWQEGALILNQAAEFGWKPKIIVGPDMLYAPDLLLQTKENSEGIVIETAWNPFDTSNQKMVAFVDRFTKKFGLNPLGWGANTYDAVYIVAEAIKQAGSDDADKVAAALRNTKDFRGVTGAITMLPDGRPQKTLSYLTVKNGQYANYVPTK